MHAWWVKIVGIVASDILWWGRTRGCNCYQDGRVTDGMRRVCGAYIPGIRRIYSTYTRNVRFTSVNYVLFHEMSSSISTLTNIKSPHSIIIYSIFTIGGLLPGQRESTPIRIGCRKRGCIERTSLIPASNSPCGGSGVQSRNRCHAILKTRSAG